MENETRKLLSYLCAMIQQITNEKDAVSDAQIKLVNDATKGYNEMINQKEGRWVTYYGDIMLCGQVADITIHKDKESATEFFRAHYRDYFQNAEHIEVKLPMHYGFPFRAFYGVPFLRFKRLIMERFNIDEKEFNRQLKEYECE